MHINNEIAASVGEQLTLAERGWHDAVVGGGAMLVALAKAAIRGDVGIGVSSEIVAEAVEAIVELGSVGKRYASLHNRCSAIARLEGLDPSAYGQSAGMPKTAVVSFPDVRSAA